MSEFSKDVLEKLEGLQKKYAAMGQDMVAYLDGLLHSEYLSYWDYVHLDTLLSLQKPLTAFPDEMIFVTYHQITELYFKLILHELKQLADSATPSLDYFKVRISRVNRYFDNLEKSFDIMVAGMDKEQFLQFRMALLPASGFQSAQYRMVEIACTDFVNLIAPSKRDAAIANPQSIEKMMPDIYWKAGATELSTGNKTLTLRQFEEKYTRPLQHFAESVQTNNVRRKYRGLAAADKADEELIKMLRELDLHVNVFWPLSHYRSAVKHLNREPVEIAATGGTNWQKYLPPRFQRVIFFPELWNDEEKQSWGMKNS